MPRGYGNGILRELSEDPIVDPPRQTETLPKSIPKSRAEEEHLPSYAPPGAERIHMPNNRIALLAGPVQPSNSLHKKRTSGKAGLNSPLKDRNAKQRRSDLAEKIDSVYLVSDDLNDCDNFDFVSPNIKPQNFSLRDSEHSDNVAGKYIKPKPLLSRVAPKRRKKPCLEEWKLVSFQRGTEQHQPAVMKFNNEDQGFKIQIDDEEKPQLGFSLQWIRSVIHVTETRTFGIRLLADQKQKPVDLNIIFVVEAESELDLITKILKKCENFEEVAQKRIEKFCNEIRVWAEKELPPLVKEQRAPIAWAVKPSSRLKEDNFSVVVRTKPEEEPQSLLSSPPLPVKNKIPLSIVSPKSEEKPQPSLSSPQRSSKNEDAVPEKKKDQDLEEQAQNERPRRTTRISKKSVSDQSPQNGIISLEESPGDSSHRETLIPKLILPDPPWKDPLLYPLGGTKRTNVEFSDLDRFNVEEFLNDNIINFYLRYIEEALGAKNTPLSSKSHFFNTYLFERLTMKSGDIEGVLKWTSRVDLFKKSFVFVPINENSHWYLAIICNLQHLERKLQKAEIIEASESEAAAPGIKEGEHTKNSSPDEISSNEWPEEDECEHLDPKIELKNKSSMLSATNKATNFSVVMNGMKNKKTTTQPRRKTYSPDTTAIVILDSMGVRRPTTVRRLSEWLILEARSKRGMEVSKEDIVGIHAESPYQTNWYDCGLYVLHYIEVFLDHANEFVESFLLNDREKIRDLWRENEISCMRTRLFNLVIELHDQQETSKKKLKGSKSQKSHKSSSSVKATTTDIIDMVKMVSQKRISNESEEGDETLPAFKQPISKKPRVQIYVTPVANRSSSLTPAPRSSPTNSPTNSQTIQ